MAKILSVDDQPENRYLLEIILRAAGYEVHSEEHGLAALAKLEEESFDLIVSDILMPEMDGFQFCREVKRRPALQHIPFVFYSATYTEEEDKALALRLGAAAFLIKPLEPEAFLAAIREILAHQEEGAPVSAPPSEDTEEDYLSAYSRRLIHKLESKIAELETTTRSLGSALQARDQEISERRQVEETLRRFHMAINQAPDGVIIASPEREIVFANPAMVKISGYPLEELLGQNPRIFKSGRHDEAFYQELWNALGRGETWRGTFVNRRRDGELWEAEASITPVLDAAGRLACYVCTQRDVTRERQLQSQLEQAQRVEAIGLLAAGIAHDFNNILMPILAHAELGLERSAPGAELRRDLEVIILSARRAAALTQQVLGTTRGHVQVPQNLELSLLVKESLRLIRAATPSTIQFEVDLGGPGQFVKGDPTQLHQVVLNLCSNAAHAMRNQPGTLSLSLRHEALPETPCALGYRLPSGNYVILEVTDTGRGMDADTLNRIFLPFFTTKGPTEGTGLGLPIVLGIVQGMRGGIQVESQPGVGSRFQIFLPLASAPEEAPANHDTVPMGTERILLVDDETILVSAIQGMLEGLGYSVKAFLNPLEALAHFQRDPSAFDLLLTDLTMPEMTGFVLTSKLRALHPGLPVLLMTGYPNLAVGEGSPEGMPDGFLTKPFSMRALAKKLREVLDRG